MRALLNKDRTALGDLSNDFGMRRAGIFAPVSLDIQRHPRPQRSMVGCIVWVDKVGVRHGWQIGSRDVEDAKCEEIVRHKVGWGPIGKGFNGGVELLAFGLMVQRRWVTQDDGRSKEYLNDAASESLRMSKIQYPAEREGATRKPRTQLVLEMDPGAPTSLTTREGTHLDISLQGSSSQVVELLACQHDPFAFQDFLHFWWIRLCGIWSI